MLPAITAVVRIGKETSVFEELKIGVERLTTRFLEEIENGALSYGCHGAMKTGEWSLWIVLSPCAAVSVVDKGLPLQITY